MRFIDSWRWRFFSTKRWTYLEATKELRNFVVMMMVGDYDDDI